MTGARRHRDLSAVPPAHLLAEHGFWLGVWMDPHRRPAIGVPVMQLLADIEREMARRMADWADGNVFRIAPFLFKLTHGRR